MEPLASIAAVLTTMALGHGLFRWFFPDPDEFWYCCLLFPVFWDLLHTHDFLERLGKLIKGAVYLMLTLGSGLGVYEAVARLT